MEAEDVDLGTAEADSLAFDVDDVMNEVDEEALDSDQEGGIDEELGLEPDDSDGNAYFSHLKLLDPNIT